MRFITIIGNRPNAGLLYSDQAIPEQGREPASLHHENRTGHRRRTSVRQPDRVEKKVILGLSAIETMDSSGMQIVFDSFSAVREAGGELRVAGANARVARLFRLTQIDTVVPFYPTVAAACQGFHVKATPPDSNPDIDRRPTRKLP